MGNIYSNPHTETQRDTSSSLLDELYGRPADDHTRLVNEYRHEAKRIMCELSKKGDAPVSEADVLTLSNIFVNRYGKTMPYERSSGSHPIFVTDPTQTTDLASPEKLRYVEIVVCANDGSKTNEKYAINERTPDHDCGPNCHCIQRTIEIQGKYSREIPPPQRGGLSDLSSSSFSMNTSSSDISDVSSDTSTFESDTSEGFNTIIGLHGGAKKGSKKEKESKKEESKKKGKDDEESDDAADDLDIDDEEEAGIMLNHSSISTSDLYRMQSRIFGSVTSDNNSLSEGGYTEEVQLALNKINKKKKTFDSEELNILDMSSDSKKFLTKKPKTNNKYN